MGIRIGNAGAPRWYDCSLERLEEYVDRLVEWGATSAELVLHHGEADERTARVHVLQEDWDRVFERYRSRGIVCHVHAPLHPRFKLGRHLVDPSGLRDAFQPILEAVAGFSERQGEAAVLVVHAAADAHGEGRTATAEFLDWATGELDARGSAARIAIELRRPLTTDDPSFDRGRESLAAFVRSLGDARVGICWDLGHDWEARRMDPARTEQPSAGFLELVNHVHLHDAGGEHDEVHYPLQSARIPWAAQLDALLDAGYRGAITLELRYRFALSMGDPWVILGGSYRILEDYLEKREGELVDVSGHLGVESEVAIGT